MDVEEEKDPFVSIVMPALDRKDELIACLTLPRNLDYPKQCLEILIWDNGIQDGTQEAVNAYFSSIRGEDWAGLRLMGGQRNLGQYIHYNEIYKQLHAKSTSILGADFQKKDHAEHTVRY